MLYFLKKADYLFIISNFLLKEILFIDLISLILLYFLSTINDFYLLLIFITIIFVKNASIFDFKISLRT